MARPKLNGGGNKKATSICLLPKTLERSRKAATRRRVSLSVFIDEALIEKLSRKATQ